EIYSQYVIQMAKKGYTIIDHLSQPLCLIIDIDTRQKPDSNNPKHASLDSEKINQEDLISQILVACADVLSLIPDCILFLNSFALAKLKSFTEKVMELVEEPYLKFIDVGLPKLCFSLRLLGLAKEGSEEEFKPIDDDDALVKGANLTIAEYGLYERLLKALSTPHQFPELLRESINVKEMEDALDAFSDFLSEEPSTTLICSAIGTGKTKTLRKILASLAQTKLKELEKFDFRVEQYQNIVADLKTHVWDLIIVQVESILHLGFQRDCSCIAILDEANTTMRQMASSEGIYRGFKILQENGKQYQDNFANIDATWSALNCIIYTSTIEASICFEISSYFDTVIGITNIATSVYVEAFAQILFRICDYSLHIDKIADYYALNLSPAVETYIEVEYQRCLLAKYFSEILCSLIASTGATLELILVEDTEKINRNKISYTIKNTEKKIKSADAESIANTSNISFNKAKILKQNPICSFANNMTLQLKLCDIDFIKRYNNSELLQHFRRQAYFKRQGFKDIDDMNILSNDDIAKTFEQSQEKIIKIREDALLLFGFKTRAKGIPDLNATIKFINKKTYWIYYKLYGRDNFVTQEEIIAIKVNNSKYFPIGPILLLYKPELIDETQDLFDSISITNNITLEYTKHKVSNLSNNEIDEKDLFLEMLAQYNAEYRKNSSQDICHIDITIFETNAY
ncbi:8962_t:CDS:10, partial [Scutellospora calospora]